MQKFTNYYHLVPHIQFKNEKIHKKYPILEGFLRMARLHISGIAAKLQNKPNRRNSVEVRNFRVTKSSYEAELHKMTSHFELLTRKCL